MKFLAALTLASVAVASPVMSSPPQQAKRQFGDRVGSTANEFLEDGCNDIIFIWARGSTEIGNMGIIVGPEVGNVLKDEFPGQVAVQGVDYAALLSTNFLPGGADPAGISEMEDLVYSAASDCPDSIIVTGGYSQGAAINHRVIEALPSDIQDRIAGVITFGDTQYRADDGQIPDFPADKVEIICAENPRDRVCDGVLGAAVLPPHLSYGSDGADGAEFLAEKIREAQGGGDE